MSSAGFALPFWLESLIYIATILLGFVGVYMMVVPRGGTLADRRVRIGCALSFLAYFALGFDYCFIH